MASERTIDTDLLTRVLSEFAHTLASRFEVSEVLYRLAEHVLEILDIAGCGVSVVDEDGRLRPVTAINELTRVLEATEEAHQEGPCVDAFHDGNVVVVPRLADQAQKWPAWSKQADELGVHAALGIPLCVNDQPLGAMNLYSHEERDWTEADIRIAKVLCDMAASYVVNASELNEARRVAEQLREALESRIIIEQAKGILAAEQRISVEEAFVVLRGHARSHGASLRSVAQGVVQLGLRPKRGGQR